MKYKLIGNELYIARKVVLTDKETKVLNAFLTFKEISLDDLCKVTRLNALFTRQIIQNINRKTGWFITIVRTTFNQENRFEIAYKLEIKGED